MVLLSILKKQREKEREMRLLILGLDNAGKTTVMKRVLDQDVASISPTVGFNIETIQHAGFNCSLWDVGGQRSLRPFWRNYFEETNGVVWVVDSTDTHRLADCHAELNALLCEERLQAATLLVLANKQDAPGALSPHQIQQTLQLDQMAGVRRWAVFGTSGITGANLYAALDWLVLDVASKIAAGAGDNDD